MDIDEKNEEYRKNWFFADLHLHSRFSRACSKDLNLDNLAKWGKIKGLHLLGTGDFTHPVWIKELKEKLLGNGKGFYEYKDFLFIITGEISLIYTQDGKGRKVHLNLLVPSFEVASRINEYIDNKGFRRDYDGRPIFGMSCEEFVKDVSKIDENIEIIPAHIWTPYFGIFGSMSGFDSLKEAFLSQENKIHAIETGISSDIPMNLKIPELRDKSIVSFSDSHSFWPWRLGREATIFKKTDSFSELIKQIRENDFIGTIETEPAYGKYHWDGHAKCGFSCSPEKTRELKGICPKCGGKLVIGVENRVESLANGESEEEGKMFFSILPLHEILSLYYGNGMNSKKIWNIYWKVIKEFENEFNILLNVSKEDLLSKDVEEKLADLIIRNRHGGIKVKPGFDGVYGEAILDFSVEKQSKLF
jgi:uncharacterized protein (TIGR00375 family)